MVSTAALAVSLCACSSDDSGRQFSATLGKKLRSDHVAEIDLATVGTFAWDELFVFDPYSTRDDNCRALALDLIECRTTFPAVVGEGEYILVFRKNSRIARAERHARTNGDFAASAGRRPQPILRSAAHFTVVPIPAETGTTAPSYRLEHKS